MGKFKLRISNGTKIAFKNPLTGEFLRNEEVYCGRCFSNFGDTLTLLMHRTEGSSRESKCLKPWDIGLKATRNFLGSLVWRDIR